MILRTSLLLSLSLSLRLFVPLYQVLPLPSSSSSPCPCHQVGSIHLPLSEIDRFLAWDPEQNQESALPSTLHTHTHTQREREREKQHNPILMDCLFSLAKRTTLPGPPLPAVRALPTFEMRDTKSVGPTTDFLHSSCIN